MEASNANRLRKLKTQNAKLKRTVADQSLDMSAMKVRRRCATGLSTAPVTRKTSVTSTITAATAPALAIVARTDGATCLAIDVSISSARAARYFDNLALLHGPPEEIVLDNGPEGPSSAMFY